MDLLTPELGLFVWTLLAFLIVLAILKKFAWKPILTALNEREKGIADSIAAADRVKGEMAAMQNENEKLMQQAREERTAMLKEAKETRDKMVNEAKDLAKAEANKVIADAQAQIHQQKMAAMTDMKNQIGIMAVEVAEKILRQQLDNSEAQNNFAKKLVADITLN
jgi:F-type H+-transporting ATPase subunit b